MDKTLMEKSYNHISAEDSWYDTWMGSKLFQADNSDDGIPFSMILPPANVTGSLHMGHALTFTIPDIIARRKKMQGYNVLWLPGVDHAGIATQMVVERNLKKETGQTKDDLGREKFLEKVWEWKEHSQDRIVTQLKKLGLSLDWSRMKFTLSEDMIDIVTKVFVQLYKEGKIYPGTYMVNRCPSCTTVLSDLEVDHKEVGGTLTYMRYPLAEDEAKGITVATTRPETMLGDTAVAVHPEDERYKDMIGKELILPLTDRKIVVIADEHVDPEFGTGAVKITPAHDPNDYEMALRHNLESIVVIDEKAKMCGPVADKYNGMDRFACRTAVVEDLKELGLIEKIEEHSHNVGHCQRCETVVEPNVSKQWFLKTEEIAKPAIDVVENGDISFVPDKWKKVYFNWMYNIQDWCISRQLWWGHRIPAYTCNVCSKLHVEEKMPVACECGATEFTQDPDVLDTWFSSALWPFSTLGWGSDDDTDYKKYYPTSVMATGFDIIFFWVARMIMMGMHFGKDIPFREVYINGLVRDEKGQKMSKTKNNSIDPLDIIEEYGADALRFTLAVQSVPGMDVSLSVSRIKGYRGFANKIWNASRYMLMNMKGDEDLNIDLTAISSADKWILHLLNSTVDKVNDLIDNYKINEAADLIYHFFWHDYCDWYLEFSKKDSDNLNTRKVLKYTLFRCLQLLHPFMPYITEEIYQKMGMEKEYLLQTKFPVSEASHVFTEDYQKVELLKKIISETRKTRSENGIEPNKKIPVFLRSELDSEKGSVEGLLKYYNFLVKSSETTIVETFDGLKKGFRGVLANWEILLPFNSEADLENEIVRLNKELEKSTKQIESLKAKLANENFVSKAPAHVVNNFKNNLQEQVEKSDKIRKTLGDLS